ncbi:ArnT family glycosyltransferase [Singulisphaera rosea]
MRPLEQSTRREILAVIAVTCLGAIFRFWAIGRLGLTHFDEGVYALSGLWAIRPGGLTGIDPMVVPYAPPGFPILIGLGYSVIGVADVSAILVSTLCGVALIPVIAWLGRRAFGPGSGVTAAALAGVSIAHIAFSRKALTDVPLLLAWSLVIGLGGRFLERPRLRRAIPLGLAIGFAQMTKYNGWLAGAIVVLTAVLGLVVCQADRRRDTWPRTFGFGLIAVGVALVVYWPWFMFVERHGGYDALVRHHQSYLGGPKTWLPHWNTQQAQAVALSGGAAWGVLTWIVVWCVRQWSTSATSTDSKPSRWGRLRPWIELCVGSLVLGLLPTLAWWVSLALMPNLLLDRRPAARILAVWWLVMSVLTPFYHPYARLWLPLHAVGWLFLARGLDVLGHLDSLKESARRSTSLPRAFLLAVGVCAIFGILTERMTHARPFPISQVFGPTDGLKLAVTQAAQGMETSKAAGGRGVQVLARRPVLFYLALVSQRPIQLHPDLDSILANTQVHDFALIDEVQLLQEKDLASARAKFRDWETVSSRALELDPVTRLDVEPRSAFGTNSSGGLFLVLLRRVLPNTTPGKPGVSP